MSSWIGHRTHFRERKMIKPITSQNINSIESIQSAPSKYINTSIDLVTDAVVCAIALNEESYIDEWIQYNLFLGFSHIYIYDNSDTNSLKDKSSKNVTIIHFPGKTKQMEAYSLFAKNYKSKHKWCAFIDCDEFIILKKHNSIIEFLNNYDKCESIRLNWLMFGTSNQVEYKEEPITKRFIMCSSKIDSHTKSICKLEYIDNFNHPHFPILLKGYNYDTQYNIINGPLNELGNYEIACIHHYYTKSEQEFKNKIERGRADITQKRNIEELDDIHNKNNDIYNSDAWDFYSKSLQQIQS
jgi:hypothetical protein